MVVLVLMLLVMSLECYWVIIYLLKFWMKGRKLIIVIVVIWLGSIFFVFFYIFVFGYDGVFCLENWFGLYYVKVYIMSVFIMLYFCLFCGIIVVYIRIGRKFYRDIKKIKIVVVDFEWSLIGK